MLRIQLNGLAIGFFCLFEAIVELIGHTRTTVGLRVKAKLDKLVCDTLATRVKCEKELENARERNASLLKLLVESVIPYEALLADAESRKWIAPSIWGAMEECRDKVRALIGVSPSSRDAQGERT